MSGEANERPQPSLGDVPVRAVLDAAPGALLVASFAGTILEANRAACRMFGYERDQLVGLSIDALLPDARRAAHGHHRAQWAEAPTSGPMGPEPEYQGLRRDGSEFPAEIVLERLPGEPGMVVAMVRNAADQRRQVDQLSATIRHQQTLLRDLNHRVHHSLQVLSSHLNLQKDQVPAECQPVLEELQVQIRSIALVHEALGRSPSASHIDLGGYLESLLAAIARVHGDRLPCAVRMMLPDPPVSIKFDRAHLVGRVVHEAVANACTHAFRARAGSEVVVSLRKHEDGDLQVDITDNGTGMPDGHRRPGALGFDLMSNLVAQLEGRMTIRGESGTHVGVRFPDHDSTTGVPR